MTATMQNAETIEITGDGLKLASLGLSDKAPANIKIRRGAVIRVIKSIKIRGKSRNCLRLKALLLHSTRAPEKSKHWSAGSITTRINLIMSPKLGGSPDPVLSPLFIHLR